VEEREELVNMVTANRKFIKGFEHVGKYRMRRRKGWSKDLKLLNASV
jgi:hypothetical protein